MFKRTENIEVCQFKILEAKKMIDDLDRKIHKLNTTDFSENKQRKILGKINRLIGLREENLLIYRLAVFQLAMIPVSAIGSAIIEEKARDPETFHVYIDVRNNAERATGRRHGHIVVDFQGRLRYVRWSGLKNSRKYHLNPPIDAEEYWNKVLGEMIKNGRAETESDSLLFMHFVFSSTLNRDIVELPDFYHL